MRLAAWVALVLLAGAAPVRAADSPPLARARALYNAADYDAAIAAATEARRQRGSADAAALVLARAHLERYRTSQNVTDLDAARDALRSITRAKLALRDQVDLLVAMGQSLFFADAFGAAAEVFESALDRAAVLTAQGHAQLLDWWAGALDREAQSRPPDRRARVFERILTRMEQELRQDPASQPANFWLVAAVRGTGDLDRAWDAAVAAWVRTSVDLGTTAAVRADLDRLVQALVTERARQRPAHEQPEAAAALRAEWALIKSQWP